MGFKREKSAIIFTIFIFLVALGSGALSIETFDQDLDINAVSPNSHIAQIVKVTDAQGQQVNQSVLLNASGNEFQFRYGDNYTDMKYLRGGYYYAFFDSGNSVSDIEYRVIDQSPGGGVTETNESLIQGQLDVNIQSNYTGRYEAGEDIQVNVTIENTGSYFAADVDNSGDITEDDILIVDNGGSGTFSKTSDPVLAGQSPPDGASLQNTNPWKESDGGPHSVAMYDSSPFDDWDPGADIIVRDFNSGGTVSRSADVAMNTGDDNEVDTQPGQGLNSLDEVPDDLFFPSSDFGEGDLSELFEGVYRTGQEIVRDTDDDRRFTTMPDPVIAGDTPSNGENITFNDTVPPRMDIASYNTADSSFSSSKDLIVFDRDNDSQFTARPDNDMLGNSPPEATLLEQNHVDAWNDEDNTRVNASDLEIFDNESSDGGWNVSKDAIWVEGGGTNGYQKNSGDVLIAGSLPNNADPRGVGDLFDQWPNVSGYDSNPSDEGFNLNTDDIIMDYNSGGTYSKREDIVIAGSQPQGTSFSGGTPLTDGFPSSWTLDIIEGPVSNDDWNGGQDTILRDRYQGGTYSAQADEIVNSGGSADSDMGTPLNRLSASPGDNILWSDVDSSGAYNTGDEIFRDSDSDDQYTNQSDQQLAGLSLEVAGEGTELETSNIWQTADYDQTPLLFYDIVNPGNWDPNYDAIVHDADQDGVFTGRGDRVIDGDPSLGENGDTLISTEPPEISAPDAEARVTVGTNTTGPLELARTESGTYTGEISIPDVPDSRMLLQVTAETPISNMRGMESRVLMTRAQGIGFDTNATSIDLDVQKRGNYTRSVRVDNLLTDQNSVNISLSDSIENMTSASVNQINLEPEGNSSVEFDFNISEMQDSEGEIIFTEEETDISQNVDVSINTPECLLKNEQLCVQNVAELSATTDQRENISMNLDILNVGLRGSERDISTEVSGNVSEFIEVENLSAFNDSAQMNVDFVATRPGNYTGTLGLQASDSVLEVPLDLAANFERLNTSVDVTPGQIDLGTVPEGNDATSEVMVENTGTTDIVNVTFSSSSFSISQNQDSGISEGESRNYTLTFSSVSAVSGEVELAASSEDESVSRSMSVSGSTVTPVTQMKNEISNRVSSLRRQANSTSTLSQLTDIEAQRSSIQTSWDRGNYAEAQSKYQTALSDLNAVEAQVGSSGTGGSGAGGTGGGF
ncbi:MAG: hypothetical protein J07AB43_11830 [Candidatus Nanosalina sp. J07AB43]|nr:MAG: hypothetical protein J07AB43_11830 [Candidatus Nanosalina sp. J07AB43]